MYQLAKFARCNSLLNSYAVTWCISDATQCANFTGTAWLMSMFCKHTVLPKHVESRSDAPEG